MIDQPIQLAAVFLGLILLSVWLDERYSWARKISPVVLILFFAGLVSNLGLITDRSPFYDGLAGFMGLFSSQAQARWAAAPNPWPGTLASSASSSSIAGTR